MYVSAVSSSFFNPYDVASLSGAQRSRNDQAQTASNQQTAASQERVIQGEVISRQRIQQEAIYTTQDSLSSRQFNRDQTGYGFNARQAVNSYIGNQVQGERIDRQRGTNDQSLIDVYV